jgi:glycosyltransferase involved in cell wall biosynthesis
LFELEKIREMNVLFVTYPALGLNMGGLQIQIEKTRAALIDLNIEVTLYDPWKCDISTFDVVHFYSLHGSLEPIAKAAYDKGIPIVTSSVFNAYFRNPDLLRAQVWLSKRIPGLFSNLSQSVRICDMSSIIIALSLDEKSLLKNIFGIPHKDIRNIPNGIERGFLNADPTLFKEKYGVSDFVLCVGKIERRKNQLALIESCRDIGIPLVLIGPPNTIENDYYEECLKAASSTTHILGRFENGDPLLASAYAAAKIFALPSHSEVLPISVFEAAAAGCKLLVTKNSAVHSELGEGSHIYYCTPELRDIKSGLQQLLNKDNLQHEEFCEKIRASYAWGEVAKKSSASMRMLEKTES